MKISIGWLNIFFKTFDFVATSDVARNYSLPIVFDVLTYPYTKVFELISIYQFHILNLYYQFRVRATIACILVHILWFRSIDIESYFFEHLLEDVDLFCSGLFCSQLWTYIQWSLVSWDNERLGWPITSIMPENVGRRKMCQSWGLMQKNRHSALLFSRNLLNQSLKSIRQM